MILHYNGKKDLQEAFGHKCFSEYFDDSRNEVIASKCFTNEFFQFVMLYGSDPEAHLQFYLHVDSNVYNSFISGCIEEEYGNDDLFVAEYNCFEVSLYRTTQRRRTDLLSLVEQSYLNFLLCLYKGTVNYEDFYAYVLTVCYKASVFKRLSIYVFKNLFRLVSDNFMAISFDEIYCILFTCIVLSDEHFIRATSLNVLNGGVVSIIFYFHSLYRMIVCGGNRYTRVVHENRGVDIVDDWKIVNKYFGLHMRPFGPRISNFLEIRHDFLVEEMLCKRTNMSTSCVNLTIITV